MERNTHSKRQESSIYKDNDLTHFISSKTEVKQSKKIDKVKKARREYSNEHNIQIIRKERTIFDKLKDLFPTRRSSALVGYREVFE